MTLDEARACLYVSRGATADEIRQAFRRRARIVHPDRHPDAGPDELRTLEAEFNRAREARDILVRFTLDPLRSPSPESAPRPAPAASRPTPRTPPPPPPPAPEPVPQAHPAATVTMRFDEFVAWWDAAGFGPGHRSPLAVDWPRIAAWAALAAAAVAIGGAAVWVATGR